MLPKRFPAELPLEKQIAALVRWSMATRRGQSMLWNMESTRVRCLRRVPANYSKYGVSLPLLVVGIVILHLPHSRDFFKVYIRKYVCETRGLCALTGTVLKTEELLSMLLLVVSVGVRLTACVVSALEQSVRSRALDRCVSWLARLGWLFACACLLFAYDGFVTTPKGWVGAGGYHIFAGRRGTLELPMICLLLFGVGALVPRSPTPSMLSNAGASALFCYMLHMLVAPLLHPYPFILSCLQRIQFDLGDRLVGRIAYEGLLIAYLLLLQLLVSRKPQIPASLLGRLPDKGTVMALPSAMMALVILLALLVQVSGRKLVAVCQRFRAPTRQLAALVSSEFHRRRRRAAHESIGDRRHLLSEDDDREMQSAV